MTNSNIDNIVIFKKKLGRNLEIDQKYVGLRTGENKILTVKLRVLEKDKEEIIDFFHKFSLGEPISLDIGNTGDIKCYFKGISPEIEKEDNGTYYYLIAITLQEIENVPCEEDESHSCSNCGLH